MNSCQRTLITLCLLYGASYPALLTPAPNSELAEVKKPNLETSNLKLIVENIHCATNKREAAEHLGRLQQHQLFSPGIPGEESTGTKRTLSASVLDRTLQVLGASAEKYPANKFLIEQTVIQWNFCSVIDNGTIYDHENINGKTRRYVSPAASTKPWHGFNTFGLLPKSSHVNTHSQTFNFTTPYTTTRIRSLADLKLQQRYIKHCLPHPDDERLYRDFGRNFISRVTPRLNTHSPIPATEWNIECRVPQPVITHLEQATGPVATNASMLDQNPSAVEPDIAAATADIETITTATPEQLAFDGVVIKQPERSAAITGRPANKPVTRVPDSVAVPIPQESASPAFESTPRIATNPWLGDVVTASANKPDKGFSGAISLNNSQFLSAKTSLNFSVAYKPLRNSYWFIRSSLDISQQNNPLSYTWGIGYDDWHPGTWGIQLNHWGPLKPGDGLDIKNAVAEISYKFNRQWLNRKNLSSFVSLTKPLSDNPAVNLGWSWNPYSHWFVRSTLSKPIGESGLNWTYGFGYTRYDANSISLEYNNWGLNDFPDHNFRKNALVSLIYRWAF